MDKQKQQELEAKRLKEDLAWFEGDIELCREKCADKPNFKGSRQFTEGEGHHGQEGNNAPITANLSRFNQRLNRREQHEKHTETYNSRYSFEIVFETKAKQYRNGQYSGYVTIGGRTLRFSDHEWQSSDYKKTEYNFGGIEGISVAVVIQIKDILEAVPEIEKIPLIIDNSQALAEKEVIEKQQKFGDTYLGREFFVCATLHFEDSTGVPFDIEVKGEPSEKTKELEAKNRETRRRNRANTNKAIAEINTILCENGLKTIPEY